MSIQRVLWISILGSCLSGCSTAYREPAAGQPSATLVFSSREDQGAVTFYLYADNERCQDLQYHDNIFAVRRGSDVELRVPVGTDLTLSAEWSIHFVRCDFLFGTFHPEPGRRYRASFLTDATSCALTVTREVADSGGSRFEIEPTYRARKGYFSQMGGGCEPETSTAAQ